MASQPTSGQRLAGGIVAFVLFVAFLGFALDRAGVIDLGAKLPKSGATATAAPHKPGQPATAAAPGQYHVTLRPGANLPGQPITAFTMAYLEKVAGIYGGDLGVSYGTAGNHVTHSFHYSGHAADIGMHDNGSHNDSEVGDRIMRACLIAGGESSADAARTAQRGGLIDLRPPGLSIECIWKVADHHDHVHIAAAPR
jgi:hypothetical protein